MPFRDDARLDPGQVEDRRGGLGAGVAIGGGGLGLVVALVLALLLGVNPGDLGYAPAPAGAGAPAAARDLARECQTGADANARQDCRIVGFVNSIQAYWQDAFAKRGARYDPAPTVFFSGATTTGCGQASAQVGPFYCPDDGKVYLDLDFLNVLLERLGAKNGPLAQGYVVAHEYGHHIQHLTGLLDRADPRTSGPDSDAVRLELQADCFAGVWARNAAETGYLTPPSRADIAEALSAAAAVGDDRIQQRTQGRITPEKWTHGSAEQRQAAFLRGYDGGRPEVCTRR